MPSATDLTADYVALHQEAGAVWVPRDFISVRGPDAVAFLQGQLSQDVEPLGVGASALSWLLQPTGKVDALLRVTRCRDDELVLDTDAGWGERVVARLEKFKLRTKATIEALPWRCLALRGSKVQELLTVQTDPGSLRVPAWPEGPPGVDVLGDDVVVPTGFRECSVEAWEALRIEWGLPKMGAELDERTIPAEAGEALIAATVSFSKGCYTGQELVARIDSRGGKVPRRLRGVVIATNVVPPVGATVRVADGDGKDVGALTSVAESLERRAPVALAFVSRSVEPPADVTVVWDGGEAVARVEALPLVGS